MLSWTWVLVFNIIATVIWVAVLIPQTYKTLKTKDTYSLSIWMYLLYPVNAVLWIIYASILLVVTNSIDNVGIIVTDGLGLCMSIFIAYIKIRNMRSAKKLNITELCYYETHLKGQKENQSILKIENKIKKIFKIKEKS